MDQVIQFRSSLRAQQWQQIVCACNARDSHTTIRDWCAEHGINRKSYYYWQRKLRQAAMIEAQGQLPAISNSSVPAKAEDTEITFKRLEVASPLPSIQTAVIVRLPNATLEVTNDATQRTLEAVLLALNSVC